MTLQHVVIVFQVIVFLFAISVHESAHAFTAWRCGDPTAKMLGRVSLNPLRHIDPFGTVVLPLIAMLTHLPVIGWAKPTPVDPRNFKHEIRDDILTSIAGPISNFLVAGGAVLCLAVISLTSPNQGRLIVHAIISPASTFGQPVDWNSPLVPISLLLYQAMIINVLLAVFNLIPVPPLDGSHVFRHILSDSMRNIYDRMGILGLILLVALGGNILSRMMSPFIYLFESVLMRI